MKANDLLRLACVYAEQDREGFIDAHAHMQDDPACVEAIKFLKELRAYRRKRWGKSTRDELAELSSVKVNDLRNK